MQRIPASPQGASHQHGTPSAAAPRGPACRLLAENQSVVRVPERVAQTSTSNHVECAMSTIAEEPGVGSRAGTSLLRARSRARSKGLEYFGEVTPAEAWALHRAGVARLVDVRSEAEWTYVGRVDAVPLVEWRAWGDQESNPRFLEQLEQAVPREVPVMFLCRSGVRSHQAAQRAAGAGWRTAINVLEGFEGELDERDRRGTRGGWRHAGLPWLQS